MASAHTVLRDTEQGDSTAFNALYFFSLHRLTMKKDNKISNGIWQRQGQLTIALSRPRAHEHVN